MYSGDFLLKIRSRYNLFTKAERKVADYVLENSRKVLFMSITDLAEACNLGDTSVFRFCKTMQLQGYQEFKMQLSLSMDANMSEDSMPELVGEITQSDSISVLARKALQINVGALNETYNLLNLNDISRAVDYLLEAREIYFFGVGSSMITAMEAMNKFIRITSKVRCVEDSHTQSMMASLMKPEDVAVIISYSGSTKDSIQVAQLSQKAGARVISITHFIKSPLTIHSDLTILCGANEGPLQGGSTSAKVSQLFLLDLLYMDYFRRSSAESTTNKQLTASAVLEKMC